MANVRVFPSPDVTLEGLDDELGETTTEAPADLVAWVAQRPFLDAGPIEDVELGGLHGRGFGYTVGKLSDAARACGAAAAQPCGATVWASGVAYHVSPGERGRIMQLDAGGQPLLVMVTEGPAAADLLTTLRFELVPLPGQVEDALRLPYFAPALAPGQRYYVDQVAVGARRGRHRSRRGGHGEPARRGRVVR